MKEKTTLCIFIDAYGTEIYKKHPILKKHLPVSRSLKTVMGFSSASDPSILTGLYPEDHGHWSCFYYDQKNSPFKLLSYLNFLPAFIFNRGRVRGWISKLLAKLYGFTGYFQIYNIPFGQLKYFDYNEKYDYFATGGIIKGNTIFEGFVKNKVPYHLSNWKQSEEANLQAIKKSLKEEHNIFNYLYLPNLDAVMHEFGTEHDETKAKLKWLEKNIEEVIEVAKSEYKEVDLYLISDHGMTDIKSEYNLIPEIEALGYEFGKDYVAIYDSTMARFWTFNQEVEGAIKDQLKDSTKGHLLSDQELKDNKVYFGDKYGNIIFLLKNSILLNPSSMGNTSMLGMHGYHPDEKDANAVMLSNKVLPEQLKCITDIREVLEESVGTKCADYTEKIAA